jgi:hypothetical protein
MQQRVGRVPITLLQVKSNQAEFERASLVEENPKLPTVSVVCVF